MITADREPIHEGRVNEALSLLESSGYEEPFRSEIAAEIMEATPDEIELYIQDLLLNQVDKWQSFRLKDINRRLNEHGC